MLSKNIDDIGLSDIQAFIDNGVVEKKTLEYKSKFPDNTKKGKIRFLATISSFANTIGGHIIYGVAEKNGKPVSADGVQISNLDQEKLSLENRIRNGIQPRLYNLEIHPIRVKDDRYIIVIRVQQSWNSPHRVTKEDHSKFYGRNSAGKYPYDVGDLRTAFLLTEKISNRIRNFVADRIAAIHSDKTPLPLCDKLRVVMHLLPLSSFTQAKLLGVQEINQYLKYLHPLGGQGFNQNINIDGILNYASGEGGKCQSYAQTYRNGIIESIASIPFLRDNLIFPITYIQNMIIKALTNYIDAYRELGIEVPIYAFLTIIGAENTTFEDSIVQYRGSNIVDRDLIQLPEMAIETYDAEIHKICRPIFDMIWNAWGFQECRSYDGNGMYKR